MNFAFFPLRQFTQALSITSKVKARLQPFIYEIKNYNMQWLFQILIQLYQYTISLDCELTLKFNSLVALKILLDTCQFHVALLVEIYFLSHFRKISTYQLQANEKQRGVDFFITQGYSKNQQVKKLGYNYVRLASEIVFFMSKIKPYKLYGNQQLAQPSQYSNVVQIMKAKQWKQYQFFAFYHQQHFKNRQLFLNKLKTFSRISHKYYDYFDLYLDKLIRKQYIPKSMDPRKIFQACQIFASNFVLDSLKKMLSQNRAQIKTNIVKLMTQFVKWGYIKASYIIQCQNIFHGLLQMIKIAHSMKNSNRHIFRQFEGTQQQRKNLCNELLKSLQIWAICIPKNLSTLEDQSNCSIMYKEFMNQVKFDFISPANFKKIRNQYEQNLQRNKEINKLAMKELKKGDFDFAHLRRTSSNLEQLLKIDENAPNINMFLKSFKTFKNKDYQNQKSMVQINSNSDCSSFLDSYGTSFVFSGMISCDQETKSFSKQRIDELKVQQRSQILLKSKQNKSILMRASSRRTNSKFELLQQNETDKTDVDQDSQTNKIKIFNISSRLFKNKIDHSKQQILPKKQCKKIIFFQQNEQYKQISQNRINKQNQQVINIDESKYESYLKDIEEMEIKKLLSLKHLLFKNNKIQIGYIMKQKSSFVTQMAIYITPFKTLKMLNWKIITDQTIVTEDKSKKYANITENQQIKLSFSFEFKIPYSLPRLQLRYQMQNNQCVHSIVLPLSFNKLINFSKYTDISEKKILRTSLKQVKPFFNNKNALISYFSDFSLHQSAQIVKYRSRIEYQKHNFNIIINMIQNSFVYIQSEITPLNSKCQEIAQFLMIILLSMLKK